MPQTTTVQRSTRQTVENIQRLLQSADLPSQVDASKVYTATGPEVEDLLKKLKALLDELIEQGPGDPAERGHATFDFVTFKLHWFTGPEGLNAGIHLWDIPK